MSRLETSFFCFMNDVLELGVERFCDAIGSLGVDGATVAVSYHASRDLRPRSSGGRLIEFEAGALYFPADRELYRDAPVQPWTPAPFDRRDLLAELRERTRALNMPLTAWTVFGFNERLGREWPELAQRNVFGDRYLTDLCPANPGFRDYAVALAADVMRYRPDRLLAESLHYHPLRDPRRFVALDAPGRLAMGLCFCEHCVAAATDAGVDVPAVMVWARQAAETALAGERAEGGLLDRSRLGSFAGGELLRFLEVRCKLVTDLAARLARVVSDAGGSLVYLDQAAATEAVIGPTIVDDALRFGVDVAALGGVVHGYQVLGYSTTAHEVVASIAAYRRTLGSAMPVRLALRPWWPDSESSANLAEKVTAAARLGVAGVDFYHYGLVPEAALARVSDVIGSVA